MKNKNFPFKAKRDFVAIKMIRAGNKEAFEYIFNKYYDFLYYKLLGYLNGNKEEAEDILMTAMAKAYQNINKFEVNMTFNAWLSSIVKNELIDYVRSQKCQKRDASLESFSIDDTIPVGKGEQEAVRSKKIANVNEMNPEDKAIKAERKDMVRKAVSRIKNKNHRIALELVYFDGLLYQEAAEKMGISLNNLKLYVYRGKAELKKTLKKLL